jgi:hypothetical protein
VWKERLWIENWAGRQAGERDEVRRLERGAAREHTQDEDDLIGVRVELSDKREVLFRDVHPRGVRRGAEWSGGRARCGRTHMRSHISAGEKENM